MAQLFIHAIVAALLIASILLTDLGLQAVEFVVVSLGIELQDRVPGCRRLGIPESKSNLLQDEFHEKYRHGSSDPRDWKIKSLWIYPLKSCAGVELEEACVDKTGLRYDRMFAFGKWGRDLKVKDLSRFEFATQRLWPKMARLRTEVWIPDSEAPDYSKDLESVQTKGVVRVCFDRCRPGLQGKLDRLSAALRGNLRSPSASIDLPLEPTATQIKKKYALETFKIWKDYPTAINMTQHLTPELLNFLGVKPEQHRRFSLFRYHELRPLYRDAPRKEELGYQPVAGFNDAYPVNAVGLSSCQALSAMQPPGSTKLSVRRFRANVILEGTPQFEEEEWRYVHFGAAEFYVSARCVRCRVPNVDPDTAQSHKTEPDNTLRAKRNVDKGAGKLLGCLSVQLVPKAETSTIRVGDVLDVKERGELIYTFM